MSELAATSVDAPGTGATDSSASAGRRRGPRGGRLGIGGWISLAWLVLVAGAAILAPVLPIREPDEIDFLVDTNAPIGTEGHLLGTDDTGYDMLARLIWGGRVSLIVGLSVLIIGMAVGGSIGLVAGFLRGRSESLLMAIVDIFLAFPSLLFLIAIVAFLGQELTNIVIGICLVSIPYFARISRATTLNYASREFVLAAEAAGATRKRILAKEVLPNVVMPLLAFGLLAVAVAIVAEGSLSFLAITDPESISWGGMIDDGRVPLQSDGIAHPALLPAFVLFLTVLAVNFLGERFRSAFDVKDSML